MFGRILRMTVPSLSQNQIELADDVSGGNGECQDVTAMSMTEIIEEVEAYGRGKRVRWCQYEDAFEAEGDF
jgi:hypothetical protein